MTQGFPGGSTGKESACNVGDMGLIPELGRSHGEGKGYPLQYSGLENSMDSSWGREELDATERLSLSLWLCDIMIIYIRACMHAKSIQLRLTLWDPLDWRPPGSSVHVILQAKILEWVAMLSSRASSWPRNQTCFSYVSCIGRWVLYYWYHLEPCI